MYLNKSFRKSIFNSEKNNFEKIFSFKKPWKKLYKIKNTIFSKTFKPNILKFVSLFLELLTDFRMIYRTPELFFLSFWSFKPSVRYHELEQTHVGPGTLGKLTWVQRPRANTPGSNNFRQTNLSHRTLGKHTWVQWPRANTPGSND